MGSGRLRLYGYFGHGNLGDESLCWAWRQLVPALREAELWAPPRLPRGRGTTVFTGGLFQDTSSRRSLAFYTAAVRWAAHRGPVALASVGVDVHTAFGRHLLSWAARGARFISGRDPESLRALSDVGATPQSGRDPVLGVPPAKGNHRGPVVLNLSPSVPAMLRRAAYDRAQREARARGRPLVGLVMARGEDDAVLGDLERATPRTPEEALDLLAQAELLIAARLHALELALLSGTPFTVVPGTRKAEAFAYLVERDLPAPIPRWPADTEVLRGPEWTRGLHRARDRLRDEAQVSARELEVWLDSAA